MKKIKVEYIMFSGFNNGDETILYESVDDIKLAYPKSDENWHAEDFFKSCSNNKDFVGIVETEKRSFIWVSTTDKYEVIEEVFINMDETLDKLLDEYNETKSEKVLDKIKKISEKL